MTTWVEGSRLELLMLETMDLMESVTPFLLSVNELVDCCLPIVVHDCSKSLGLRGTHILKFPPTKNWRGMLAYKMYWLLERRLGVLRE